MENYFKNINDDWYTIDTVFNTELYPNQNEFTQEMLEKLNQDFPDGNTPKSIIVPASDVVKNKLNDKINAIINLNSVLLIDITAHIDGNLISGIVNYKENGQHIQKRF